MTRLEKRNRRKTVRKLFDVKRIKPIIERSSQNMMGGLQSLIMKGNTNQQEANARPKIGFQTEREMKALFENEINQLGGTCTVENLARALRSKKIADIHATELPMPRLKWWRMQITNDNVQARYQLRNALFRVMSSKESLSTELESWPKAREILSREMDFASTKYSGESNEAVSNQRLQLAPLAHGGSTSPPATIPYNKEEIEPIYPSAAKWQQIASTRLPQKIQEQSQEEKSAIEIELENEQAKREEEEKRKLAEFEAMQKEVEEAKKKEEADRVADSMLRDFTDEEQAQVEAAIYGRGNPNEVLVQIGGESVTRASMQKLSPGQWVGDEAITCFLLGLAKRDEELCRNDPNRKRCHFFNSFFMTKLLNEGHDTKDGQYEYKNVKRWSKKVPGKDIFNLDKIFFPINQGRSHWICAVVFMQEKKIQFYDSLGADGMFYLRSLFRYIQDEHEAKKGSPLPDKDEWQLVPCTDDTPQQANGFDCGVFLCTFADFISMGYPLSFTQQHINKCRNRIALSLLRGQAIE